MTTGYYPADVKFEIVNRNKYGVRLSYPDDARDHFINPEQRWLPHTIEDCTHPAKIGDIVTLNDLIAKDLFGMTVGFSI